MFLNKANHNDSEIPTSSLADIVFLLLIFFLVTTSIDTGKALNLILPQNDQPVPVDKELLLNVFINDLNRVAVEGEEMTIEQLKREIREGIVAKPELIVSLKTGYHTEYQAYIMVLDKIKEAYGDKTPKISIVPPDDN